jgi:hypothetical protein
MSDGRMPFFSQVLTKDQIAQIIGYERDLATKATAAARAGAPAIGK